MSFYTSDRSQIVDSAESSSRVYLECPDLLRDALSTETAAIRKKWIPSWSFKGPAILSAVSMATTFIPEISRACAGAEGKNANGDDVLYAAQSFADMPNGRREYKWPGEGFNTDKGWPFNQMMLFLPTEFKLKTTRGWSPIGGYS